MHGPKRWDARLWQGLGYLIWTVMLLISLDVLPVLTDTAPESLPSFYVLFVVLILTAYIVPRGPSALFFMLLEATFWWLWITPLESVITTGGQLFERFGEIVSLAPSVESWRAFFLVPSVRTFLFGLGAAAFIAYFVKPLFLTYRVLVLGLFPLLLITITDTFFPYDGRIGASLVFMLLILLVVWQTIGRQLFYNVSMSTVDPFTASPGHTDRSMKEKPSADPLPFKRLALSGRWFAFSVVLLVVFGAIGYVSPKAAPVWPDPVPFLTSLKESLSPADEWIGRSARGRGTGLREDDRHLGGPFQPSDTVMFEARPLDEGAYSPHYWRMETKDTYTGTGWQSKGVHDLAYYTSALKPITEMVINGASESLLSERHEKVWLFDMRQERGRAPYFPAPDDDVEKTLFPLSNPYIEEVRLNGFTQHVFYDGWIQKVGFPESQFYDKPMLTGDHENGALRGESTARYMISGYRLPRDVDEATLDTIMARYRPAQVQRGNFFRWYQGRMDDETYARTTQLPDTLPERVKSLAHQLVEKEESPYEAAKAIERYLNDSTYLSYETDNVPYVGKHEDFVDQFLFETQRGYCDHFSTSMVVMLREVGIPARWVKGFAPGTVERNAAGQVVTVIRARDAHAWVEAYLPGLGWWAFEPTPSFADRLNQGGLLLEERQRSAVDVGGDEGTLPKDRPERTPPQEAPSVQEASKSQEVSTSSWWETLWGLFSSNAAPSAGEKRSSMAHGVRMIGYVFGAVVLAVTLLMLTVVRRSGVFGKRDSAWRRTLEKRALPKRIERLFHALEKRYGQRAPTMSARDYVAMIKDPNVRDHYIQFVRIYEAWRYHPSDRPEKVLDLETSIEKVKTELLSVTEKRKLKNEL